MCLQSDYSKDQRMRYSDPFVAVTTSTIYRNGIDPALESRLKSVFERYTQAGLYVKWNADPITRLESILTVEKALLCLQRIVPIHHSNPTRGQEVEDVRLSSYGNLLCILAGILALALVTLIWEACRLPRSQAPVSNRRRQVSSKGRISKRHQENRFPRFSSR